MGKLNRRANKPGGMGGAPPIPRGGKNGTTGPEKTAAWPGVPGKTQSKDRSNGVRKLKIHPKSEGI
jgi:hypothetical protein